MTFDDHISIKTPEGIEIQMNLAGLGSRISAALIDAILLVLLLLLAGFGIFGLADRIESPILLLGLGWLVLLVLTIGYFVLFESLNAGRTPGKAMFSIRVLGVDGEPVGFGPSLVRNLLRLVDLFPLLPVLGAISILVSERNQRLGDLAARTIVVRDADRHTSHTAVPALDPVAAHWDVSGVDDHDVDLARRYLSRRADLMPDKREELASDISNRLRAKVPGISAHASAEWIVEQVIAAKVTRTQG